MKIPGRVIVLLLSHVSVACGDSPAALMPLAPTPALTFSPPTISAITPSTGSTGGGTSIRINGAGFQPGALVAFGGRAVPSQLDTRFGSTALFVTAPPYSAGPVDVMVTNPDHQSAGLADAYTYAPPASFDFNGRWSGYGNAGQDIPIEFTINDNTLISVACDNDEWTFSPGVPVEDGQFSFTRAEDGVVFSGRIVAVSGAVGSLHFAQCTNTQWSAAKY
jgi:hypothetical protein